LPVRFEGRVLGERDAPLAGVRVEVLGVRHQTVTNSRGEFRLELPPGVHRLRAVRLGYETLDVDVQVPPGGPAEPLVVRLTSKGLRTAPVRVRASRLPPDGEQAPGRWALGPEELRRQIAGFEDVMRGVQALPGVSAASDLHGEMFVRGSDARANAIYLDGIEIFFPFHILGFNSIFSPGAIAGAEFWSGGAPAEFGDATGGVLALTSRGLTAPSERGHVSLSYLSGQAHLAGGDARRGWEFDLRRSYHDKVLGWAGVATGREIPAFHDVMLRGRWQPLAGHLLAAGLLRAGDGMSLPTPEVRAEDFDFVGLDPASRGRAVADLESFAALNDRLHLRNRLSLGSLYWRALLGPRAWLETTFGVVPQDFDFSLRGDNDESVRIRATTLSLRQDLTWRGDRHRLRAGLMAYRDRTERQISAWAGILNLRDTNSSINLMDLKERWEIDAVRRRDYGALYVQDEWIPRSGVVLGGGLRWEHDGLTGQDLVSPRASLELHPGPGWTWRGTFGVYHALRDKPMEVQPTPDGAPLGAERSYEVTLGTSADLGDGLRFGAGGWLKRLADLVYEAAPARYANGGEGRARGLEAWMRFAPERSPWRATLDYTWSRVEQRDPVAWRRRPNYYARSVGDFWGPTYETPYWYHPAQDERHRLGLEVHWRRQRWDLGARYQLGSGRPYTPVRWVATDPLGTKYGVVGDKGSARYPLYQRLDVRLLRQLHEGGRVRWSLYTDVLNITGADNVYQYRYNPAYTTRYTVRMLPTLPTLGIEARF
jgi:hypothetical protein